jgi:hypothetical protein
MNEESLNNEVAKPEGFENWPKWKQEEYDVNGTTETPLMDAVMERAKIAEEKASEPELQPDKVLSKEEIDALLKVTDNSQKEETVETEPAPATEQPEVAAEPELQSEATPVSQEEKIIEPESVAEQKPESTTVVQEENNPVIDVEAKDVTSEENAPKWNEGIEWQEFEILRRELAEGEIYRNEAIGFKTKKNLYIKGSVSNEDFEKREADLDDKRFVYEEQKKLIAEKIKESFKKEAGENLTPKQEAELKSKINDIIFKELIQKENDAYIDILKANRRETLVDKAKENFKNLLGSKAMQWYLGLSKKQRMALSFGLGTVAGLTVGAGVGALGVAGYVGKRIISGAAGIGAGEWAGKKWSVEELNQKEKDEVDALKNSDKSLEEKSKELAEIEKKYKRERVKMTLKRVGVTVAAGAGTGLLTNLAEGAFTGTGGVTRGVTEARGGKTSNIIENNTPKTRVAESLEKTSAPEKMFSDPSVLKHEVAAGDSTWKILKETLDHNDQFKGLTEAQKTYVLSTLTNKMLQSPENYGLSHDGIIHVGDKTDFTKLFEDTKEVSSILSKAKGTIAPGSPQEASILSNNEKISSWVETHQNQSLNEDKVAEILSNKPKVEVAPEPEIETPNQLEAEALTQPVSEPVPEATPETGHNDYPNEEQLRGEIEANQRLSQVEQPEILPKSPNFDENQIHQEIAEAKRKLAELENHNSGTKNPNMERSFTPDIYGGKFNQNVEEAFRSEINDIYGKKGLLGIGKISGVNTKEWAEMARLPATKIVEYYTGDSTKSDLSPEIIKELIKSKSHGALMRQTIGLMEQSSGAVKPFANENMEQFIKRLGGYVLKTHLQKAA